MSETDRILHAMTEMDEFTVVDLVRACDASASTVRTVLGRRRDLLDELGREETGRPGGKWKRYRLRADAAESLAKDVGHEPEDSSVPTELLAAEEMLLASETIGAEPAMRESLLRRARRLRHDGVGDTTSDDLGAWEHLHAVDALITLVEGEGADDWETQATAYATARMALPVLSENEGLSAALERRIRLSPLRDLTPSAGSLSRGSIEMMPLAAASLQGHVVASVLGIVSGFAQRTASPEVRWEKVVRPTGIRIAMQARGRALEPIVHHSRMH
jgi:hypothetical protein